MIQLLERIAAAVEKPQVTIEKTVIQAGNALGNDFPTISHVAAPSKMEVAKQWLIDHPEDQQLTGRDLETGRNPMNMKISYRTWNDAKKELT